LQTAQVLPQLLQLPFSIQFDLECHDLSVMGQPHQPSRQHRLRQGAAQSAQAATLAGLKIEDQQWLAPALLDMFLAALVLADLPSLFRCAAHVSAAKHGI
jgi:hypothetical protein